MTVTVTRTVSQYRARGLHPGDEGYMTGADAAATAKMMLRDQFQAHNEIMSTEPTSATPVPVIANPDFSGWTDWKEGGPDPTGDVVVWTATGRPAWDSEVEHTKARTEALLTGTLDGGAYVAQVPPELTEAGGSARIVHGLDSDDVLVAVYAGDEKVGYMFAVEMSPNEVHVEFFAGATTIRVDDIEPGGG